MAIRFNCENCHKPLEVDDQDAGKQVLCYYCQSRNKVPRQSDPELGGDFEAPPQKKSPVVGLIGLGAAIGVIVLMAVLLMWTWRQLSPIAQDPAYMELPPEEQELVIRERADALSREPVLMYGSIAILILTVVAVGFSIAGLVTNSARVAAAFGLIISGIFLMMQILAAFRGRT